MERESFQMELYDFMDVDDIEDDDSFDDEDEINPAVSEEQLIKKYSEGQLRIVRTTMDFPLNNLEQVFSDKNYLDLSPSYQRRNRWDLKKKSLLIESLLMNIPIPPVFLFEKEYNSYEVMDGRQRIQTITDFLENKFALVSLEFWKELRGKTFKELPIVLQRGLLRRTINAIVLLAETSRPGESNVDVRMVLFRRLNTGGVRLNPQELRNALYPGRFNDMLLNVSRTQLFTDIWGIPEKTPDEDITPSNKLLKNHLYKSMGDCELVLRFFAIRETIQEGLKGSLRKILDDCMVRHMNDNDEKITFLSQLFLQTLSDLYQIFDEKPFLLPNGKISSPLYDSLMVAYSSQKRNIIHKKDLIQSRLSEALADKYSYETLTGKGNSIQSIRDRVSLASSILGD